MPILSEKAGKVKFHDIIEGVTMKQEVDEATGAGGHGHHRAQGRSAPADRHHATTRAKSSPTIRFPSGAHIVVNEGDKIVAGTLLAKTPRKIAKTKDITGGLPRVAELFEARRPKDAAEISKIDGIVDFGASVRGKRSILIKDPQTGAEEEHLIPIGKHIIVFKGDFVKKGQQLTEGPVDPHEILEVCGPQELQEHLVNEVQEVYRLQGVTINDKHIEIIVRQMLRKVRITEPGDTPFLWGEQIDKLEFEEENEARREEGRQTRRSLARAARHHQGLAGNRQLPQRRVLPGHDPRADRSRDASKVDYLRGFKENVIMGHLIPAGTGFDYHRKTEIRALVEVPDEPEVEETPDLVSEEKIRCSRDLNSNSRASDYRTPFFILRDQTESASFSLVQTSLPGERTLILTLAST